MKQIITAFSFALLCTAGMADIFAQDCTGHPLFSNMSNFEVSSCQTREFDKAAFTIQNKEKGAAEVVEKSGEIMEVAFRWKGEWEKRPAPLQIYQNYDNAIRHAGGQVLFRIDDTNGGVQGKLRKGGDNYWVKINTDGSGYYYLTSIKEAPIRQEVVVTADEIKKGLGEEGRIAFYGIYFDTDKVIIKPESANTLQEMARFLKAASGQQVYIVGHTDNAGDLQHNLTLSKQRAGAVVAELTGKYGVNPAQLSADGVGPLVPVAVNKGEENKARNRRVEMVLR